MDEQPMTKTEVREWMKRTREALRAIDAALTAGDEATMRELMIEWTAPGCEVEAALDGAGIRGVS